MRAVQCRVDQARTRICSLWRNGTTVASPRTKRSTGGRGSSYPDRQNLSLGIKNFFDQLRIRVFLTSRAWMWVSRTERWNGEGERGKIKSVDHGTTTAPNEAFSRQSTRRKPTSSNQERDEESLESTVIHNFCFSNKDQLCFQSKNDGSMASQNGF